MSNVHLDLIEEDGDLVDIEYYHHRCNPGLPDWPAPERPEYPVTCAGCGAEVEL